MLTSTAQARFHLLVVMYVCMCVRVVMYGADTNCSGARKACKSQQVLLQQLREACISATELMRENDNDNFESTQDSDVRVAREYGEGDRGDGGDGGASSGGRETTPRKGKHSYRVTRVRLRDEPAAEQAEERRANTDKEAECGEREKRRLKMKYRKSAKRFLMRSRHSEIVSGSPSSQTHTHAHTHTSTHTSTSLSCVSSTSTPPATFMRVSSAAQPCRGTAKYGAESPLQNSTHRHTHEVGTDFGDFLKHTKSEHACITRDSTPSDPLTIVAHGRGEDGWGRGEGVEGERDRARARQEVCVFGFYCGYCATS